MQRFRAALDRAPAAGSTVLRPIRRALDDDEIAPVAVTVGEPPCDASVAARHEHGRAGQRHAFRSSVASPVTRRRARYQVFGTASPRCMSFATMPPPCFVWLPATAQLL